MTEPIKDIERRRPVWEALSDLFLDTELQDLHFRYIARVLAESGYDDQEVQKILHHEVAPVCLPSLMSLTGAWAGFPLDWLEERILRNDGSELPASLQPLYDKTLKSVIAPDWQKVQAVLPQARHRSGNPYKPYRAPDHWPATVVQLANALHNRQDCGFALCDALLEAGHPELADHFAQEQSHADGCWVLDLLRESTPVKPNG
jgi:hypothetical protein